MVDAVYDAGRYWERRRLTYNLVLVTITVFFYLVHVWMGYAMPVLKAVVFNLGMAVVANVLFTLAYPIDLAARPVFRGNMRLFRDVLFGFGMILAGVLALVISATL